jgi:hypothetical protein
MGKSCVGDYRLDVLSSVGRRNAAPDGMEGDMNLRHTLVLGALMLTLGLALGGQALAKPTSSGWFPAQASPPAASFYTAAALKANGLRWQAMARSYERHSTSAVSSSNGFDVRDALLGGAVGLILAICVMAFAFVVRRGRRPQVAL